MTKSSLILNNLRAIILGLVVFMGASYVMAVYSVPTCEPTGCNTDAPIDSTSVSQAKSGRLIVGTFDTAPLTQYVFAVKNALAYVQALATNSITLIDGTEADGLVLTSSDDTGLATWRVASSSVTATMMYVDDFRLYVKRSAGSVSVSIPSTYQYCAISQLGPDFANSDKSKSTCSVNQNTNKSWTLLGERGDDPGFWCNARCFSVDSKPVAVTPVNNPVISAPKTYYCGHKHFSAANSEVLLSNPGYTNTTFGCSTVQSFDPVNAEYKDRYDYVDAALDDIVVRTSTIAAYEVNTRRTFADQACGVGNWTINPVGANESLASTGFKCN